MLITEEYEYFSKLIVEAIDKIESGCIERTRNPRIGYWHKTGGWIAPVDAVNVTFYNRDDTISAYTIDIEHNCIKIIPNGARKHTVFSTEAFFDNSDAAFFQGSMIEDTSILETDFLRSLIKISLLLRDNYNVQNK